MLLLPNAGIGHLPVQKHCCSHTMFHEFYTLSAICSVRFPTVAWRAAYESSYTAADRWFHGEEISSFCQSSWASGPGHLVAVAFSLLWLPRVMLHLLHQGPVVQSKCTVGSSYQSSMDHCRPLWSRSRHPINPKKVLVQLVRKSWSLIYYSITVSCYRIYWFSNIFLFSAKREKNFHLFNFSFFRLIPI